ncbi:MAG: LacI family DNA-binding transcriptional regulator [Opitutales bacterium]
MSIGVSIHDVAKAAGVSPTTVSQALRQVGRISQTTRERVRRVAEELGYHPNPLLSSLASKQFRDPSAVGQTPVAVLAIEVTGTIGKRHQVPERFKAHFAKMGYRAQWHRIARLEELKPLLDRLYSQGFQGLMLSSVNLEAFPREFGWERFAVVQAGPVTCPVPFHRVDRDVAGTVRQALQIMVDRGYRRLGSALFCHDPPIEDDYNRLGAVLSFKKLDTSVAMLVPPLLCAPSDMDSYQRWARRYKPDGVLSLNGYTYVSQGHADPEWNRRMGTVCFELNDNVDSVGYLAGFRPRIDGRRRVAAMFLDQLIRHGDRGIPEVPQTVLIPAEFQDGPSLPRKEMLGDPQRPVFQGWDADKRPEN